MLRWLQPTVRIYGGYGSRLHLTQKPYSKHPKDTYSSHPNDTYSSHSPPRNHPQRVNVASNPDKDLHTLVRLLNKPSSPEKAAFLYESIRTSSRLQLSPRQFSTLISMLGNSGTFWSLVLRVAEDKTELYKLNHGDHYWVMNACSALATKNPDLLSKASFHYRQMWTSTQSTDLLVPFLEALISSGSQNHLHTAAITLCRILGSHSNLHTRSLQLIWNMFISFPESLNQDFKTDILLSLWNRIRKAQHSDRPSHYLATHMFNPFSNRHEPVPLGVPQLVASLGAPMFSFFQLPLPISVQQWGRRQLLNALSLSSPIDVRWANISLFAFYQASRRNPDSPVPIFDEGVVGNQFSDWHIVLSLALLENITAGGNVLESDLRSILRALWVKWEQIPSSDRPLFVSRAIVSAFLRLSARTRDTYILDRCRMHSQGHSLWRMDPTHTYTAADRAQIKALVGDFSETFLCCHGRLWVELLHVFGTEENEARAATMILQRLIFLDVGLAHEFYSVCVSEHVQLETHTLAQITVAMAPTRVHDVFPILQSVFRLLNHSDMGSVLLALMDALRQQRCMYLSPSHGRILGSALLEFFSTQKGLCSPRLKYPLRYTLLLLVISQNASDVIRVVKLVNELAPSFFNARFLHRLLRTLLRHRQLSLASALYQLVQNRSDVRLEKLRQRLVLGIYPRGGGRTKWLRSTTRRSVREDMTHRIKFRDGIPLRWSSPRVIHILRGQPHPDIPSIKYALRILFQSKRAIAAKRVFQKYLPYLDLSAKTWFGNVFLHRITRRYTTRNIHVLKRLVRAQTFLVGWYGFIPDRVTFNIFMKGMLLWNNVEASQVRMLFDDCVRIGGYPVGSKWRRFNDKTPFGTRRTSESVSLRKLGVPMTPFLLNSRISFERHVRPLYKMFIKAFYLRKDVVAAKTVVGILKNAEAEELGRLQYLNRQRYEGTRKRRKSDIDEK